MYGRNSKPACQIIDKCQNPKLVELVFFGPQWVGLAPLETGLGPFRSSFYLPGLRSPFRVR